MSSQRKRQAASGLTRNIESLESRRLLSASLLSDLDNIIVAPASRSATAAAVSSSIKGYTPAQIRKAYGFDQIKLANGVTADGAGQTIAIVTAYNDPKILSDVHTFDVAMGLTDNFTLSAVSQTGGKVSSLATDAGWAGETALDVEWAHAIAPKAKILLVEAKSASLSNMLTAVDYARHAAGVSVVSMSWGADEFWSEAYYDKYFTTPTGHQGVTFVAASGDEGSWWGPSWPSSSSNVLAVGGTTLNLNSTGTIGSETGWSGSGGGVSSYEYEPTYQANAQRTGARAAPDVSYDANPYTGFAFYNSVNDGSGRVGWGVVGGTSAGAPQWAALVAIANQGRAAVGKGSLDGSTGTLPMLYSLYNNKSAYSAAFNDVTLGRSSFWYSAHTGYDAVTGLGTPKAAGVVSALVGRTTIAATTAATATATARTQTATQQAKPAEQTVAQSTSDVEVAPRATAPLAVQTAAVDSLIRSGAAEIATTAAATNLLQRPGDTVVSRSAIAGGASERPAVFSSRRISTAAYAGYESVQRAALPAVWSNQTGVAGATAPLADANGPWILSGIAPIDSAGALAGAGGYGGNLSTLPAPNIPAVSDAAGASGLTGPRAWAVAVAAVTAEVLVLCYRRARRKNVPTTSTTGANAVEPIIEPLDRDER
jgi:hypothetical protein